MNVGSLVHRLRDIANRAFEMRASGAAGRLFRLVNWFCFWLGLAVVTLFLATGSWSIKRHWSPAEDSIKQIAVENGLVTYCHNWDLPDYGTSAPKVTSRFAFMGMELTSYFRYWPFETYDGFVATTRVRTRTWYIHLTAIAFVLWIPNLLAYAIHGVYRNS